MEENANDMNKERLVLMDILDLYKDLPCLWDISHNHYKNKQARQNALEVLCEKWKIIDADITVELVKKKLENMRATFLRERKKVESSRSTGAGRDDIYTPALWYYDHMLFLVEKQAPKRRGVDSIDVDDEAEKTNLRSRTKKPRITDIQTKLLESAQELMSSKEDPIANISTGFALQLKEMSKMQRFIAEKLISEVLFYGKIEQLTITSSINLNGNRTILSPSPQMNRHNDLYAPTASLSPDYSCIPSPNTYAIPSPSPPVAEFLPTLNSNSNTPPLPSVSTAAFLPTLNSNSIPPQSQSVSTTAFLPALNSNSISPPSPSVSTAAFLPTLNSYSIPPPSPCVSTAAFLPTLNSYSMPPPSPSVSTTAFLPPLNSYSMPPPSATPASYVPTVQWPNPFFVLPPSSTASPATFSNSLSLPNMSPSMSPATCTSSISHSLGTQSSPSE